MRVLHINANYLNSALHQSLVKHLNELGIEDSVFCPVRKNIDIIERQSPGVVVNRCFNKWDRFFYYIKQNKIVAAIEKSYNVLNYDCIHAHTLFTDGGAAMQLSKKYGIPYVVAVRNTDVNAFFKYRFFLRKRGIEILKNASKVFFLSPAYMDQVLNKYVSIRDREDINNKSVIVPNGIDDFWYANKLESRSMQSRISKVKTKQLSVICVAAIDRNKNIPFVVKVIDNLNKKGWQITFEIVGKILDEHEYDKIKEYDFVRYYAAMSKEELVNRYRANELFIMLSHYETFGLVYAEALSQGLPVIYTRGQGFDGQFAEGEVGYAASDVDEIELEDVIEKVTSNYGVLAERIWRLNKPFWWVQIADTYSKIYGSLSEKGR